MVEEWTLDDMKHYAWEQSRPECACCGEHITDESAYFVGGQYYCEECMDSFKVYFDD